MQWKQVVYSVCKEAIGSPQVQVAIPRGPHEFSRACNFFIDLVWQYVRVVSSLALDTAQPSSMLLPRSNQCYALVSMLLLAC